MTIFGFLGFVMVFFGFFLIFRFFGSFQISELFDFYFGLIDSLQSY